MRYRCRELTQKSKGILEGILEKISVIFVCRVCPVFFIISLAFRVGFMWHITQYWDITSWLCLRFPIGRSLYTAVDSFIGKDAIETVIETVGLSSVFLIVLYAALDKKEWGITYLELLKIKQKRYKVILILYFTDIIAGLWLIHIDMIEPAMITVISLLFNTYIQWTLMESMILVKDRRQKLARKYWENRVVPTEVTAEKGATESVLMDMVQELSSQDMNSDFDEFIDYFLDLLIDYWKMSCDCDSIKNKLQFGEEFWQKILENRAKLDQENIIQKVLNKVRKGSSLSEEIKTYFTGIMCSSYVVWQLCNALVVSKGNEITDHAEYENLLGQLMEAITYLENRKVKDHVAQYYLEGTACVATWVYFLLNWIGLDSELLQPFQNTEYPVAMLKNITSLRDQIIKKSMEFIFESEGIETTVDIAYRQAMCKREGYTLNS